LGGDSRSAIGALGFDKLDFATLQARYGTAPSVQPHAERFAEYLGYADALGIKEWIRFDLTIVRGLAYYTGVVFELFDAVGEFRAICGGGRYDNLLSSLGGVDLPALGFGMGDVVLGELLRERGKMPTFQATDDRYFIVAGEGVKTAHVLTLASSLRRLLPTASFSHGLNPAAIETRKTAKQLDDGRASGANFFIWLTESNNAPQINVSYTSIKAMHTLDAATTNTLLGRERGVAMQREAGEKVQAAARALAAEALRATT
ncbi:MAG: ATP phosphoribosyltransferase regulatory subunit, partial [Gemmatimonadaceae bacterium]